MIVLPDAQVPWLYLRSLSRGVFPLLLHSRLLVFLGFPLSLSLLDRRTFFEDLLEKKKRNRKRGSRKLLEDNTLCDEGS